MDWLFKEKIKEDRDFIQEICSWYLNQRIVEKEKSNDFTAIFVEGRDRIVDSIEEF